MRAIVAVHQEEIGGKDHCITKGAAVHCRINDDLK